MNYKFVSEKEETIELEVFNGNPVIYITDENSGVGAGITLTESELRNIRDAISNYLGE